jgi:GH18 family chitinase
MTRIAVFLPEYATSVAHVPRLDIASIPGDRITDLIYCFAGFDAQGSTFAPTWPNPHDAESGPRHNTGQLALLKARYPALNIVMSIGGWYNSFQPGSRASPCFSVVASTPALRQSFVQQCVAMFITPQFPVIGSLFTGIDIDWEYPKTPADVENIVLLLQEFRSQLDAAQATLSREMTLSACFASVDLKGDLTTYKPLAATLDWFNLMTYGAHEANNPPKAEKTDFGAPLYSSSAEPQGQVNWTISSVVESCLAAELPAAKLVFGVNTIGRSYMGVPNVNNGLYQSYSGPGPASPSAQGQGNGALAYFDIVNTYLSNPSYKHFYYEPTQNDFAFSAADGIWVSYDGPQGIQARTDYIAKLGLGGLLLWELSTDLPSSRGISPKDARALIDAMPRGIAGFANPAALLEIGAAGPALAMYSGQIFLAMNKPKDGRLQIARSDDFGATFGGTYESQQDVSDTGPALAATEAGLKIGWRGRDKDLSLSVATVDLSPDANGKLQITGLLGVVHVGETSEFSPALATFAPGPFPAFPEALVLAWTRSGDKRLCFRVSKDGGATFGPIFVSGETSSAGPALAVWGGAVNVAWLGSGNEINVASLIVSIGANEVEALGQTFPSPGASDSAPALASDGSRLIVAWRGEFDAINVSVLLGNGETWTGNYVSGFSTEAPPALASDGFQVPIAWLGFETIQMNVAQLASY